jgi:Na+-driven multidrug efflux pump
MTTASVPLALRRERFGPMAEPRACVRLAAPLAAAQLATVIMGFTDTVMMGRLGKDALAGGALGVSYFSTLLVVGRAVTRRPPALSMVVDPTSSRRGR